AAESPGRAAHQAALSLGGLRMALFPDAASPFARDRAIGSLPA
ncbi:hypothetical protein HMPREF0731_1974, partial [Pseudoroseomonas cervicalis ATCC 49957]